MNCLFGNKFSLKVDPLAVVCQTNYLIRRANGIFDEDDDREEKRIRLPKKKRRKVVWRKKRAAGK